jgi:hypothetical protein
VQRLLRVLTAPAHWSRWRLGAGVLVLKGLGLVGMQAWAWRCSATPPVGCRRAVAGLAVVERAEWEALEFKDEGDAREAMERALDGVRRLTEFNPENKIPASLQARVLELCKALDELLQQWERSKGNLSLQDSFHARHIAISYLPEALNTYLSIPAKFATTKCWTTARPRSTPSRTPSPSSSPRCASSATTWPRRTRMPSWCTASSSTRSSRRKGWKRPR